MGSPWQSPETQAAQPPWPNNGTQPPRYGPPSPGPKASQQARHWGLITAVVAVNVVAVAAAALITYSITKQNNTSMAATAASPNGPSYSDAEHNAAKDKLCHTFDSAVRGTGESDGLIVNGDLNIPVVLRKINSVAAVQNSLSPATPNDVAEARNRHAGLSASGGSSSCAGRVQSRSSRAQRNQ